MTLVKVGVRGDGRGSLRQYRHDDAPTFGDELTIDESEYIVEDVRRFHTKRRSDVVQVRVTPLSETA